MTSTGSRRCRTSRQSCPGSSPRRTTLEDLSPYAEALIAAFGARRVLFGSDWPACLLAASYSEVAAVAEHLTSGLTPSERSGVFGGNAAHWYRLDTS
jgi:L-fuconolactonase